MSFELHNILSKDIKELHHAHLLVGEPELVREDVFTYLQGVGYETEGNPDIWSGVYSTLTIDEARAIKDIAYVHPLQNDVRIFYIGAGSIPDEAQNALLKLFEEPSEKSKFFLCVPHRDILLVPLLSRLVDIAYQSSHEQKAIVSVSAFLTSIPSERIELLKKVIESKDRMCAEAFLKDVEMYYHKKKIRDEKVYSILWDATKMLRGHNMSPKTILEHVALTLPTS